MKNVFKVVFVIIGTLIGAGFASGQEMYIFFFSYGINGIYGIIISSSLMGLIIYKSFKLINKYNINNYKDFINIIFNFKSNNNLFKINNTKILNNENNKINNKINNKNKINKNKLNIINYENKIIKNKLFYNKKYFNLINIINIVINIFILITFFIMVAGFGAYFEQEFNLNNYIGSAILAIMCFLVFKNNIKGLVKINEYLIPFLIFLIVVIGLINLKGINFFELNYLKNINNSNWFISSILYCSYNSILLIPVLITLRNFIKNKKQIFIISIISSIIIILLSIILFLLLIKADVNIASLEMPIVYVVSKISIIFKYIYGFIIVSSIFTTSISLGISFLQNVSKNKKSYTQIAVIMCIIAVFISQLGFANLVNLLYPIFGYLGIIQILTMISK